MNTLLIYWVLLPTPVKLALWVVLGIALAAALWRVLPAGRARKIAPVAFLLIYLAYPFAQAWIVGALADYRAQKDAWLAMKCRETMAGPVIKAARAFQVDGFLVAVNYDKLVNDRFQRAAGIIEAKRQGTGSYAIDTGSYGSHPIHNVIAGRTFAEKAYRLLTQKQFSYVEFALAPDSKGEYSNAGFLNTQGWSGTRYRLYYLAPGDHPNCVNEAGEGQISGGLVMGGRSESPRAAPDKPFCLALEITEKAMSKHRLVGDELRETVRWEANLRGLKVPAWMDVRWDRIQVTSDEGEHYRYLGFDYPDEVSPKYRCNNPRLATSIVGTVLVPDASRAFYRAKAWYEGSAVQRFFEPERAAVVPEPKPATSAQAGEPRCPDAQRKGGGGVVDQLDDLSRPARSRRAVQSVVGGTQPASFLVLGRDSSISLLAWSGTLNGAAEKEKFLVRIFKDMDGVPGALFHESEVLARARSAGQWSGHSYVFEARMRKLTLPVGDYWLAVLSPLGAKAHFFWYEEPAGDLPRCGSGGITRNYETGRWGGGGDAPLHIVGVTKPRGLSPPPQRIVHRNARGYSFRLEAKPRAGQESAYR